MPDAKTIWMFRERLTRAGAIDGLFRRFDAARFSRGRYPCTVIQKFTLCAFITFLDFLYQIID